MSFFLFQYGEERVCAATSIGKIIHTKSQEKKKNRVIRNILIEIHCYKEQGEKTLELEMSLLAQKCLSI